MAFNNLYGDRNTSDLQDNDFILPNDAFELRPSTSNQLESNYVVQPNANRRPSYYDFGYSSSRNLGLPARNVEPSHIDYRDTLDNLHNRMTAVEEFSIKLEQSINELQQLLLNNDETIDNNRPFSNDFGPSENNFLSSNPFEVGNSSSRDETVRESTQRCYSSLETLRLSPFSERSRSRPDIRCEPPPPYSEREPVADAATLPTTCPKCVTDSLQFLCDNCNTSYRYENFNLIPLESLAIGPIPDPRQTSHNSRRLITPSVLDILVDEWPIMSLDRPLPSAPTFAAISQPAPPAPGVARRPLFTKCAICGDYTGILMCYGCNTMRPVHWCGCFPKICPQCRVPITADMRGDLSSNRDYPLSEFLSSITQERTCYFYGSEDHSNASGNCSPSPATSSSVSIENQSVNSNSSSWKESAGNISYQRLGSSADDDDDNSCNGSNCSKRQPPSNDEINLSSRGSNSPDGDVQHLYDSSPEPVYFGMESSDSSAVIVNGSSEIVLSPSVDTLTLVSERDTTSLSSLSLDTTVSSVSARSEVRRRRPSLQPVSGIKCVRSRTQSCPHLSVIADTTHKN